MATSSFSCYLYMYFDTVFDFSFQELIDHVYMGLVQTNSNVLASFIVQPNTCNEENEFFSIFALNQQTFSVGIMTKDRKLTNHNCAIPPKYTYP